MAGMESLCLGNPQIIRTNRHRGVLRFGMIMNKDVSHSLYHQVNLYSNQLLKLVGIPVYISKNFLLLNMNILVFFYSTVRRPQNGRVDEKSLYNRPFFPSLFL